MRNLALNNDTLTVLLGLVPPTDVFFASQTPAALEQAVKTFELDAARFDPGAIRRHAQTFNEERFRNEFSSFVAQCWTRFQTLKVPSALSDTPRH